MSPIMLIIPGSGNPIPRLEYQYPLTLVGFISPDWTICCPFVVFIRCVHSFVHNHLHRCWKRESSLIGNQDDSEPFPDRKRPDRSEGKKNALMVVPLRWFGHGDVSFGHDDVSFSGQDFWSFDGCRVRRTDVIACFDGSKSVFIFATSRIIEHLTGNSC